MRQPIKSIAEKKYTVWTCLLHIKSCSVRWAPIKRLTKYMFPLQNVFWMDATIRNDKIKKLYLGYSTSVDVCFHHQRRREDAPFFCGFIFSALWSVLPNLMIMKGLYAHAATCWLDEDMSNWANQPPGHTVRQQITSKLRPHSYSLLIKKKFGKRREVEFSTVVFSV